jgi:hypothetical protein
MCELQAPAGFDDREDGCDSVVVTLTVEADLPQQEQNHEQRGAKSE